MTEATDTTPKPAVNSRHHLPGYLTSPQAARLAGMTDKQISWWAEFCPPSVGVAASIGKGGASTRRYSPFDVWKLVVVRGITTYADRRWSRALVEQAWQIAPTALDLLRPRNAYIVFCEGEGGPNVRFSLTSPPPGDPCATLVIPLAPAFTAMAAARTLAES